MHEKTIPPISLICSRPTYLWIFNHREERRGEERRGEPSGKDKREERGERRGKREERRERREKIRCPCKSYKNFLISSLSLLVKSVEEKI